MITVSPRQSLQQDLDEVLAIVRSGSSVMRTGNPRRLRQLGDAVRAVEPAAVVFLGQDDAGSVVLSVDADASPAGARLVDRPGEVTARRG